MSLDFATNLSILLHLLILRRCFDVGNVDAMRRKSVIGAIGEMVYRFQLAAQELVISLFEKALSSWWRIH